MFDRFIDYITINHIFSLSASYICVTNGIIDSYLYIFCDTCVRSTRSIICESKFNWVLMEASHCDVNDYLFSFSSCSLGFRKECGKINRIQKYQSFIVFFLCFMIELNWLLFDGSQKHSNLENLGWNWFINVSHSYGGLLRNRFSIILVIVFWTWIR